MAVGLEVMEVQVRWVVRVDLALTLNAAGLERLSDRNGTHVCDFAVVHREAA